MNVKLNNTKKVIQKGIYSGKFKFLLTIYNQFYIVIGQGIQFRLKCISKSDSTIGSRCVRLCLCAFIELFLLFSFSKVNYCLVFFAKSLYSTTVLQAINSL